MESPALLFPRDKSVHRAPQHARFQHPTPPSSSYAHFPSQDSAMPRFYSAVPRMATAAGNLRLLHKPGEIADRDDSLKHGSVHGRFQGPWSTPLQRFEGAPLHPPKLNPTCGTTPTPGSLDDPPHPHFFVRHICARTNPFLPPRLRLCVRAYTAFFALLPGPLWRAPE